jgi:hypothetical protein
MQAVGKISSPLAAVVVPPLALELMRIILRYNREGKLVFIEWVRVNNNDWSGLNR